MSVILTASKSEQFVGIIPAAGKGTRLSSLVFPKELVVLPYKKLKDQKIHDMRVACEFCIECLNGANVDKAYVVISSDKLGIVNFLKDGNNLGLKLGYVYQAGSKGLAHAIDCAYPFMENKSVVLVFPDTIIHPTLCINNMLQEFKSRDEDVVLGIFDTEYPSDLCQVVYDKNLQVKQLFDKDKTVRVKNTWGSAAWRPRFNRFLHEFVKTHSDTSSEYSLSDVFSAAINAGLKIFAYPVSNSVYLDIGTPEGLNKAIWFFK
jgi:glucose-1-phosphate thymidylyltransferase